MNLLSSSQLIYSSRERYDAVLTNHKIDLTTGFLSYFDNLEVALPPKFEQCHDLVCHIAELLKNKTLIPEIHKLSFGEDDLKALDSAAKATKVFAIFAYLTNAYIHTIDAEYRRIPPQLWIPYSYAGKLLGIREIYCLWAPIHGITMQDREAPCSYDNTNLLYSFTDTPSEAYFFKANYLSTRSLIILLDMCYDLNNICYKYLNDESKKISFRDFTQADVHLINEYLNRLADIIEFSSGQMQLLFSKMDPLVFFDDMRFYFRGYSAYANEGGVQLGDNDDSKLKYVGPSSGQDPSVFLLKKMLGIEYPESMKQYEQELMEGFRKPHKDFVELVGNTSIMHRLKEFDETGESFEKCLANLRRYYQVHKALVIEFMEKPGIMKGQDISKMRGVGETPIEIIKNIKNFIE